MAQAIASAEQQTGGKAIGSGIEDQDGAIFLEVTVLKDGQRRKVLVDATASPEMMIGSWCGTKFVPRRVASRPGLSDVAAVRHNAVQIKSSLIPAARPGDADHGTALFFEKDSQEPPVLLVHGSCCDLSHRLGPAVRALRQSRRQGCGRRPTRAWSARHATPALHPCSSSPMTLRGCATS